MCLIVAVLWGGYFVLSLWAYTTSLLAGIVEFDGPPLDK